MKNANAALNLKFIESYLRDGSNSANYSNLKRELYHRGYSQMDVISLLVEGGLYGNLDNFYHKHPMIK